MLVSEVAWPWVITQTPSYTAYLLPHASLKVKEVVYTYDGTGPSVLILSGVSFTDCTEIRDNNDDYSIIGGNDIYSENHNPICSPKSLCLLTSPGEYGGSCYGDAAIWASVTLFDNDCSPTCVGFGYCISSCSSDNWYVPVVIRYQ